ncbi:MAG: MGMT family protein [Spirochaetaceae bacterium]|jgi:methylated-DNA-protein-cysteine methyltransferase-like protein|nr:MGMT family protein [Spirochaetaceae bacterium]
MTAPTAKIIAAIRSVPPGKVASYRDIGLACGMPNGARQVARLLHSMSETQGLPWHRIIRSDGSIALREGEGKELQAALLRDEGVAVSPAGRIDIGLYGHLFSGR